MTGPRNDCAINRRSFLGRSATVVAAAVTAVPSFAATGGDQPESLVRVIGITTGGLNHQRETGSLTVFTLPKFMRDELGMQLINGNTRWLQSYDRTYVERVRETAEAADCYFTNLKVNHRFGDLSAADADERNRAMSHARQLIKAAKTLGARWIRFPVPKIAVAGDESKFAAHRELAAFAGEHGVQLLVENGGWMKSDAESIHTRGACHRTKRCRMSRHGQLDRFRALRSARQILPRRGKLRLQSVRPRQRQSSRKVRHPPLLRDRMERRLPRTVGHRATGTTTQNRSLEKQCCCATTSSNGWPPQNTGTSSPGRAEVRAMRFGPTLKLIRLPP